MACALVAEACNDQRSLGLPFKFQNEVLATTFPGTCSCTPSPFGSRSAVNRVPAVNRVRSNRVCAGSDPTSVKGKIGSFLEHQAAGEGRADTSCTASYLTALLSRQV